jgi:ATP synthase protein I
MSGSEPPANRRASASGASVGWAVFGTLLSGVVVWTFFGWLLDRWLHTSFLMPIGALVGIGAAVYLVYVKFGKAGEPGRGPERGSG